MTIRHSSHVTYRSLRLEDMKSLAKIIVNTWRFDCFFKSESAARHFGLLYLADCLIHATYTLVAEVDKKAVGIIIGADYSKKHTNFRYLASYLYHGLCLVPSFLFRLHGRPPMDYNKIMQEMDHDCPEKGNAEIVLFIMDDDYRGMGIGSKLYESLMADFRENEVGRCYVHTDTVCNYRFYEAFHMKLLSKRKTNIAYAGMQDVTMFLYGADIKQLTEEIKQKEENNVTEHRI